MTQSCKIYTSPANSRVLKALIAAQYNGVTVDIAPGFEMGVTNKSADFLAKFPLGKIPAMETPEGPIYESNAIAHYVANLKADTTLFGKNKYEAALVQQYISLADNEILPPAATWIYPLMGYMPYNKANTQKAMDDLKKVMGVLDKILAKKTFFVGERVTLADITIVCSLMSLYKTVFDADFRKPFPNVNRWFLTCVNQPQFVKVVGEVKLCTVREEYDPKKFAKEEPKKEAPKKAAKKDEEEPEESYEDEKPAGKNPLDLLPPSKFNLENWKRFYSNNDTRPTAINFFWDNYDPEGFSIWRLDYKYNAELTKVFMSSNLIGGFFQRLERARKYAFGTMCVLGEDGKNEICGYFVFRGQDVPFEVKDAADYESYNFNKVSNIQDPAFKETFGDFLAWDGKMEGKKFADGKIFK